MGLPKYPNLSRKLEFFQRNMTIDNIGYSALSSWYSKYVTIYIL